MRIIDKYLLKEFLLPLLYCFDAFMMLFIVLDLLDNLPDFIQHHARFSQVFGYYLIVLPEAYVLILPMSLLLATLFCLSNLGKNNELIAMRSSGISVLRMAVPFLAVGVVATLTVFAVNDKYVPTAKERASAYMNEIRGRSSRAVIGNFFFVNPTNNRDWYARRFDTRAQQLESVEVHQRRASDNAPVLDVFAQSAVWTNNQWRFFMVDIYDHTKEQEEVVRVSATNFPAFNEGPGRLAIEGRKPDQLTTQELRRHIIRLERSHRTFRLGFYKVTYYFRQAFPLTCLVVIWIGFPLGVRTSRRGGALLGIGMALLLVVAFFFLTQISVALGRGDRIPPALAAWFSNGVFAIVGTVLMIRSR